MKFLVGRSSEGAVSKHAPCVEAIRGPEAKGWPGEYEWYVEINKLEDLVKFLDEHGGGLSLWSPEEGSDYTIEILDESDGDEE